MFERIKKFFKPRVELRIVELPPAVPLPELDMVRDVVLSLQSHPGFLYLLNKCRLQRGLLESTLTARRHETLKDVEFIQSGIAWSGWLVNQLEQATRLPQASVERQPTPSEEDEFQRIIEQLDVLR